MSWWNIITVDVTETKVLSNLHFDNWSANKQDV